MTTANQLRKYVTALETGADHARQEALLTLRGLEQSDWQGVTPDLVQSILDALKRQLLTETRIAVVDKGVAVILGSMGTLSKEAAPQLTEMLQDGMPECVREAAALALGRMGSNAKSAARRLAELASSPSNLGRHAVHALGEIGVADQHVRTALTHQWRAPAHSYHASVELAVTLCKLRIHVDGAASFLADTLLDNNQDTTIRIAAADGLAGCDKTEVGLVPALLVAHSSDKNELIQKAAFAACLQLCQSHASAIQQCAKQLNLSPRAEVALRKTGALAIPALVDALGVSDTDVRLIAARILSGFGELAVAAVSELTGLLRDKNPDLRLAAAKCLWNITKNADLVVPVLLQLLDEKRKIEGSDDDARRMYLQTVLEALARIGSPAAPAAVPAIVSKMKDKNRLVRQTANEALKKIQSAAPK